MLSTKMCWVRSLLPVLAICLLLLVVAAQDSGAAVNDTSGKETPLAGPKLAPPVPTPGTKPEGTPAEPIEELPLYPWAGTDLTTESDFQNDQNHALASVAPSAIPHPDGKVAKKNLDLRLEVIQEDGAQGWSPRRVPRVLYWPDRKDFSLAQPITGLVNGMDIHHVAAEDIGLRVEEIEWSRNFAHWVSLIFALGDKRPDRFTMYYNDGIALYFLPPAENVLVRFVNGYPDKTIRYAGQVQILVKEPYSSEDMRQLLKALPDCASPFTISESKMPLLPRVFDAVPLADEFKNAAWRLASFGYDSDYQVAKVTLTTEFKQMPFALQVAIGPRGGLFVLSGNGLNRLPDAHRPPASRPATVGQTPSLRRWGN